MGGLSGRTFGLGTCFLILAPFFAGGFSLSLALLLFVFFSVTAPVPATASAFEGGSLVDAAFTSAVSVPLSLVWTSAASGAITLASFGTVATQRRPTWSQGGGWDLSAFSAYVDAEKAVAFGAVLPYKDVFISPSASDSRGAFSVSVYLKTHTGGATAAAGGAGGRAGAISASTSSESVGAAPPTVPEASPAVGRASAESVGPPTAVVTPADRAATVGWSAAPPATASNPSSATSSVGNGRGGRMGSRFFPADDGEEVDGPRVEGEAQRGGDLRERGE